MEDKNITINETKYNFFKFYNMNQPLTELKYFNTERLIFTKPVTRKLPNNNISFNRVFVAITGPKPRTVTDKIKGVYDVNELLNYDSQTKTTEFTTKYDFSKLEDIDYHVLIDYNWYTQNIDSGLKEPSFVYNLSDKIYHDEPAQKEFVMAKFKVFDATEMYRKKPTLINKIPTDHYHILLDQKWLNKNISEKYLKKVNEEHHPLVFPSEEVFSFGVALNTLDTNNTSYQISLCLYDRENPKDEEIKWAAKYEELATMCRDYLKKSEFKKLKGQIDAMKGLSWKGSEVGDADANVVDVRIRARPAVGDAVATDVLARRQQGVECAGEADREGHAAFAHDAASVRHLAAGGVRRAPAGGDVTVFRKPDRFEAAVLGGAGTARSFAARAGCPPARASCP